MPDDPKPPFPDRRRNRRTDNPATAGMDETVGKAQLLTPFERTYAWRVTFDELLDKYVQACKSIERQESNLRPMAHRMEDASRCLKAIYNHIESEP